MACDHGDIVLERTAGRLPQNNWQLTADHLRVVKADVLVGMSTAMLGGPLIGVTVDESDRNILQILGYRYKLAGFCPDQGTRVLHLHLVSRPDQAEAADRG